MIRKGRRIEWDIALLFVFVWVPVVLVAMSWTQDNVKDPYLAGGISDITLVVAPFFGFIAVRILLKHLRRDTCGIYPNRAAVLEGKTQQFSSRSPSRFGRVGTQYRGGFRKPNTPQYSQSSHQEFSP